MRKRRSEIWVRQEAESAMAFSFLGTRLSEAWRWCLLVIMEIYRSNVPMVEAELTLTLFCHPCSAVLSRYV